MDRATSSKDKLSRRLSSLKVVVDLLYHELDLGKGEQKAITIERPRFEAALTTIELFIEDMEVALRAAGRGDEKSIETMRTGRPA